MQKALTHFQQCNAFFISYSIRSCCQWNTYLEYLPVFVGEIFLHWHCMDPRGSENELSKRKVLRMIIIVVVTFALCWLPTHIQHLLIFYFNNTYKALLKVERLNSFLFFLPHANNAVNPCLLISLNERFTNEFKGILRCLFCRNPVLTRRSIGTEPPVVLTRIPKTVRQCSNSVIPLRTQQRPRSQSCSF